VTVMN